MRWPRPSLEPAYSAKTAPMTATATAILAPLSAAGRAAGASAQRKACQRVAPSVRMQLALLGVDASPGASSVVTTIGKKQTSATIASLGRIPKPNQTTSSGAMITIGTACEATSSG